MPGEDFEAGAKREALEETGVDIELDSYLLRIKIRFQSGEEYIDWTSHVFTAKYAGGIIAPRDAKEIREAKVVSPDQIPGFVELMASSGVGGLIYRSYLTKEAEKRL